MTLLKSLGLAVATSATLTLPAMAQSGYQRGNNSGEAIIYANPDFTGRSIRVTSAVPRLTDYRFNDRASSIRITGGAWEVCVDANYRGRCEIIEYREDRLNQIRLNDNISSIRPVAYGSTRRDDRWDRNNRNDQGGHWDQPRGPGYNAPVVLYQHDDYRGNAVPINGAVPHLNTLRINDAVSSIAIQSGSWEVCVDPNYRGRCEIITASTSQLGYVRLNDNISSIRPAGRGYGR